MSVWDMKNEKIFLGGLEKRWMVLYSLLEDSVSSFLIMSSAISYLFSATFIAASFWNEDSIWIFDWYQLSRLDMYKFSSTNHDYIMDVIKHLRNYSIKIKYSQ